MQDVNYRYNITITSCSQAMENEELLNKIIDFQCPVKEQESESQIN